MVDCSRNKEKNSGSGLGLALVKESQMCIILNFRLQANPEKEQP